MDDFVIKVIDDLDQAQKKVVESAVDAIRTSYSPYLSQF